MRESYGSVDDCLLGDYGGGGHAQRVQMTDGSLDKEISRYSERRELIPSHYHHLKSEV